MHPGKRFQELRDGLGLKQEDVGRELGLDRSEIARFEGNPDPKWSKIVQMLDGMKISLPKFFESKVPDLYPTEADRELHEQLQEILEANPKHAEYAQGVILNIEAIYEKLIRQTRAKRAAPPVREKRTGP